MRLFSFLGFPKDNSTKNKTSENKNHLGLDGGATVKQDALQGWSMRESSGFTSGRLQAGWYHVTAWGLSLCPSLSLSEKKETKNKTKQKLNISIPTAFATQISREYEEEK